MILLKIDPSGELEWNLDEIRVLAELYDKGCKSEEAHKAKIIELIWNEGFNAAVDHMEDAHQKAILLMGCVGGNA
jgi:hypothetical protein